MNRLTKQWCDEVRGSKEDEVSLHKLSLSSDREDSKAEDKVEIGKASNMKKNNKRIKGMQRVHFNRANHVKKNENNHHEHANVTFESESSYDDEDRIIKKDEKN